MAWQEYFIQTGAGGARYYREMMERCTAELEHLFENAAAPYSGAEPEAIEQQIAAIDLTADAAAPLAQVIGEVQASIAAHSIIVQHPHCIAHLHTPPLISGLAAERFIAAQNLSMDSWDQSGAATYIEQRVVKHLCALFDLPGGADGVFTSGGTQANTMALIIARNEFVMRRCQHDVQRDGLPDYGHRLRIIASTHSHFTVEKAASIMGLGHKGVVKVAASENGAMDVDQLESVIEGLLAEGLIPFAIVGTAGTTDHGAIDDLTRIGALARRHGLWFHVDAAYGSALVVSQSKHRLLGIEGADSLTVDFHKMWFQPVSCGALLLRDGGSFRHLLYRADYLNRDTDDLPNLVDKTVATTRRFDALKLYMLLRSVGTRALGAMVDHLLQQTQRVASKISSSRDFELLAQPQLTTVLFRCRIVEDAFLIDEFNRRLRSALLRQGIAVLGETRVAACTALKLTLLNPCFSEADAEELLTRIAVFARQWLSSTAARLADEGLGQRNAVPAAELEQR